MSHEQLISSILKDAFARKKKENRHFSLQVIANKLEISISLVSQIMNGKRSLTPKLTLAFGKVLDLDSEQLDQLITIVMTKENVKPSPGLLRTQETSLPSVQETVAEPKWAGQPKQNFWVLREWYYLPIMDATYLPDCDGSADFFSKRLGLPLQTAQSALDALIKASMLEWKEGKLTKTDNYNNFQSSAHRSDILTYHKLCLKKALETLEKYTDESQAEVRLINSATLTVPSSRIAWAKQKLSDCLRSIAVELANGPEENVYQMSIQFFPLTSPIENKSPASSAE